MTLQNKVCGFLRYRVISLVVSGLYLLNAQDFISYKLSLLKKRNPGTVLFLLFVKLFHCSSRGTEISCTV